MDLHRQSAEDRRRPKVTAAAFLESPGLYGCLAGYSLFHVSSAGELCPCAFVPLSFGNVFAGGLEGALRRAASAIRRPCSRCMAPHAAGARRGAVGSPAAWEESREILARFEGGGPAAIMKALGL